MLELVMLMLERNQALPPHCSLSRNTVLVHSAAMMATGARGISMTKGSSHQAGLSRAHRIDLSREMFPALI